MAGGKLTIDLGAIAANWRALDAMSAGETAGVVKADAYGLGLKPVATCLAKVGARSFFVALASEGAELRQILGPDPMIGVFSGHMAGDTDLIAAHDLTPMLNSPEQWQRHRDALPDAPYGVQLDSGMHRLGFQPSDWAANREALTAGPLRLVMSHLACADEPEHGQNIKQLESFTEMCAGLSVPRSLSATGGILLGPEFQFDLTRPGIGLYGGLPFAEAKPVVRLQLPVVQCRWLEPGDAVGYGATFTAPDRRRIATVSSGYADGLIRAMTGRGQLWQEGTPCPLAGRVSMDLMGVDVTGLGADPEHLDILGPAQGIDALAEAAGTIGYEILTSLGARYDRVYVS